MLRAKPKPKVRSGIERGPERRFPTHLQWIRTRACSVPGCENRQIEAAHVRLGLPAGEQGGTGMKPSDIWTIPLCARCHFAQHTMGEETFARKNGINMVEIALACQKQSPHRWRWEQEE